ncbi:MAG TPA: neutral/alkaline non-lysosomal ceramidase N-terminal domain-containing protein, partial [Polyangiales bacterium]
GCLCPTPEIGTPVGGGAEDHPTFWRALDAFQPGTRRKQEDPHDCQNPKYFIQGLGPSEPGVAFPEFGPVGVAQLGNGLLVTLPAELTTVVGMRIRESVQRASAAASVPPTSVAVVGLTHEYLQYVASADEYPAQHYEGASTLYGPHMGELLRAQTTCLTASLWGVSHPDCARDANNTCAAQQAEIGQVHAQRYDAGFFHARWLHNVPSKANGAPSLDTPTSRCTADGALALETELGGVAPKSVIEQASFQIQVLAAGQVLDDDTGSHLRARWDDDRAIWTLSWTPDVRANPALCGRKVSFRVKALATTLHSKPAVLDCDARRVGCVP